MVPTQSPSGAVKKDTDDGSTDMVQKIQCSSKITMGAGEKVKLQVQVKPAAAKKAISFQSSDTSVVSVQKDGKLQGRKTGTARITVFAPGIKKTVTVHVKKAPKTLKISVGKRTLKKGKSRQLKIKFSKGSASYRLKFLSLNPKIISVSANGKVRAKKAGTARIRVTSFNGKKAYIKLKVVS